MTDDRQPQLALPIRHRIAYANWAGEFRHLQSDPRFAGRFLDDAGMKALPGEGRAAIVAAPHKELRHLAALYPPGAIKRAERFGAWALIEL